MRRARALALALLLGALVGCGSGDGGGADAGPATDEASEIGADRSVCLADASPAPDATDDLPAGWTFPPETTAYDVEHRAGVGTIVTAVTGTPFDEVLDHLNHEPGVTITSGETEEDDAEADWTARGHTGRWAIRKSATCAGETVVQVLSTPAG